MIYLKSDTRETMEAGLLSLGILIEAEGEVIPADGCVVTGYLKYVLPTIWGVAPVFDAEGNVTTPGVPVPGFHANVLCRWIEDPAEVDWPEGIEMVNPEPITPVLGG